MAIQTYDADEAVNEGEALPVLTPLEDAFLRQRVGSVQTRQVCYIKACETVGVSLEGVQHTAVAMRAKRMEEGAAIQAHLAALRSEQSKRASCTRDDHLAKLAEIRDKAIEAGALGPAHAAERSRGQVMGHYAGMAKDAGEETDASALAALVSQIGALLGPEAADTARRRLGIKAPAADSTLEPSVPRGTSVQ